MFAGAVATLGHRAGWAQGHNIIIEYRYAEGSIERLHELVADTIASRVDVIVVQGEIVADAVKRATTNVPVVALVGDAVASGLAASLARPGGNITGFSSMEPDYGANCWRCSMTWYRMPHGSPCYGTH